MKGYSGARFFWKGRGVVRDQRMRINIFLPCRERTSVHIRIQAPVHQIQPFPISTLILINLPCLSSALSASVFFVCALDACLNFQSFDFVTDGSDSVNNRPGSDRIDQSWLNQELTLKKSASTKQLKREWAAFQ